MFFDVQSLGWCLLDQNTAALLELNGCACVLSTIQVITNLVKMVKARDIRRPFCPAGHWLSEEVNIRADKVPGCDGGATTCL